MSTLASYFNGFRTLLIGFLILFSQKEIFATEIGKQDFQIFPKANFTENKGQLVDQLSRKRDDVLFYTQNKDVNCFLKKNGISYIWYKKENTSKREINFTDQKKRSKEKIETYRIDVEFLGANLSAELHGEKSLLAVSNYYLGGAAGIIANVQSFEKIIYKNIYNNIDLVIYMDSSISEPTSINSQSGNIKYDFIVNPGGNPKDIKIQYNGNKGLKLLKDGTLEVYNPLGVLREGKPFSYQINSEEHKIEISSEYKINKNSVVTYNLQNYDTTKALIIDPSIHWATYYGGAGTDYLGIVGADASGNSYLCGNSNSIGLATVGSYRTTILGLTDVILVKFNSSGVRQWATYFGGNSDDYPYDIKIDPSGTNVYLAGWTSSTSNIASSAHQTTFGGISDAFLAKFNSSGAFQWCTYYGGSGSDYGYGLCIDLSNNVYLSGQTASSSGISTVGSFQGTIGGGDDNFLVKFNSSGVRQWGTYYGGDAGEFYGNTDVDANGNVYLAGSSTSDSTIPTTGVYQSTNAGWWDAYLVKFNSSGIRKWATFYGGTSAEFTQSVKVDPYNNIIIAGLTRSTTGIAYGSGHQQSFGGGLDDAFVAKFNTAGTLQWSSFYGGSGDESGDGSGVTGLAILSDGAICFGGTTTSTNNISTSNSDERTTLSGDKDVYLVKFSPLGARLWGSYYGGTLFDRLHSIATYNSTVIYFSGATKSTSGIASGGHQNTYGGGAYDLFLVRIDPNIPVVPSITTQPITGTYGCGNVVSVPFTTNTTFNPGNVFTVQSSDLTGAFNSPGFPITLASGASSPISVTLPYAPAGTNYRLRVVSSNPVIYGSYSGPYTATDLVGSNLANPIEVGSLGLCGTYTGSAVLSSNCYGNDYNAPYQTLGQGGNDVYYRFTTTVNQWLTFSTCRSSFDTYIHLLDGQGNWIASDDDNGPRCLGLTSSIEKYLTAGTYYIVAEGYDEDAGTVYLDVFGDGVLNFDGSNDNVEISNTSTLNLGTGPFTFEATVRSDRVTTVNHQVILSKRNTATSDGFMFGIWSDGHIWCQLHGGNFGWNQGATFNDGKCHHIALTRDNLNSLKFYVDGVLTNTVATASNNISSTGSLRIGSDRVFSGLYFDGNIKNVRVWALTRTQTEIQTNMNVTLLPTTGLVGYWRLNEGSGQTLADRSSGGSSGLLGINNTVETTDPAWQCPLVCPVPLARPSKSAPYLNDTMSVANKIFNVKVFPNPFSTSINLVVEGNIGKIFKIEILNMQGIVLYKNEEHFANELLKVEQHFAAGMYILKVSDDIESATFRIVKME